MVRLSEREHEVLTKYRDNNYPEKALGSVIQELVQEKRNTPATTARQLSDEELAEMMERGFHQAFTASKEDLRRGDGLMARMFQYCEEKSSPDQSEA